MPKVVDRDEQMANLARCTVELIARVGLEQTTLRLVAEEAGCTKGMVQYYFEDKEALLQNALVYVTDRYHQRVKATASELRGLAMIESRYMAILPLTKELHDEWSVRIAFYTRASTTPHMQKLLSQHYQRDMRAGVKDLEDARELGEIKADIDLADSYRVIMSTIGGLGLTAVMNPKQLTNKEQVRILRAAIDALRA
jgi:AcrR family transcriptional regulator